MDLKSGKIFASFVAKYDSGNSNFEILQDLDEDMLGERQVALAQTLVLNLRNTGVNKGARDLADKLLEKLLRRFPALLWRPEILAGLLSALDAKDSSGYQLNVDPRIIFWLRKVKPFPAKRDQTQSVQGV